MIDALASPPLNDVQQRALDSLRSDGIAALRFDELFGDDLWDDVVADIAPFIRETEDATKSLGDRPESKEELIVRRFYAKKSSAERTTFALESPWLRYAASPLLLDVVNAYGGEQRRLFYLDNWYTVPYPAADARVASQRWHRDPEHEHVVKVFVYFSDVDEDAGPFEYVRSSATGGRHGGRWPWAEGDCYPPEEEFASVIPVEDRLSLTGPPGTMIICDTGGFHRGGFARAKPRILSVSSYLPPGRKKSKRRFDVELGDEILPPQVGAALA